MAERVRLGAPVGTFRLKETTALEGLTPGQQLFVSNVMAGMSYAEAYRAAGYSPHGSAEAVGHRAGELAKRPAVQAKLAALRAKRDEASTLAPLLTRQWITEGIMRLAQSADKDATKLAALIALGKIPGVDLFRDVPKPDDNTRSVDEIDRELREALRGLNPVIDGTARRASENPAPAAPRDRRRKHRDE